MVTDEYEYTRDLDLLGDWLDAKGYTEEAGLITRSMDYMHKQADRIAELEAALRPFADVESIVPFFHDAGWGLYAHVVTKRDMEAARAALEKKNDKNLCS